VFNFLKGALGGTNDRNHRLYNKFLYLVDDEKVKRDGFFLKK